MMPNATDDSSQTVQVTAKAPKWLLPSLLALAGIGIGAGTTRLSAGGMAEIASAPAAEAAARKVLREVDPPTKAEVRQLAREESAAAVESATKHMREILDREFRATNTSIEVLRGQADTNAQTLRQIEALLRQRPRR